jgi:predicted dehydrogenase
MSAEINLNNMTLITRRDRQVPKLVGKVLPNLDEAAQLVSATVSNTIEFVRGRQRFYPGMARHFSALYRALLDGKPPPVNAEEAREVVWLVEEIWRHAGIGMSTPVRWMASA